MQSTMQSNSHPKDKDRVEFWHEKGLKWLDSKLWCVWLVSALGGHNQLMHMRIRYHFLADFHVTRHVHARETESEKHIRNIWTNLVAMNYRNCKSNSWLSLSHARALTFCDFVVCHFEFTDYRKSQTSTNTSDRGEKWQEAWIIVEGSRSRKFDFSDIYATIVTDLFLLIFWSTHVSHLFFSGSFGYCV